MSLDRKASRPIVKMSHKGLILNLLAFLICFVPMSTYGQDASDVAESRLACAQGLGQQAVNRAREMGFQGGLADVCVKGLSWMANNGKLLDLYAGG